MDNRVQLLIFAIALAIFAGIFAGKATKNVDAGIAVFAGLDSLVMGMVMARSR